MLEREEAGSRRQRTMVITVWLAVVGFSTVFMTVGGFRSTTLSGIGFGISACFWLLFGMVFLVQHYINHARIELPKELKQIQLQVPELRHSPRPAEGQR